MASVRESIEKLKKAWIGEGRALPVLYPMETVEMIQFAEACGVSQMELLEVMRALVQGVERAALEDFVPPSDSAKGN